MSPEADKPPEKSPEEPIQIEITNKDGSSVTANISPKTAKKVASAIFELVYEEINPEEISRLVNLARAIGDNNSNNSKPKP